jgi:hypothetical protein
MNVAVFVDAGYLYALGCMARFQAPQPRVRVDLDIDAVVRQLKFEVAALDGGGGRLIRIYWYDGAPKSGMTADQYRVAAAADVKLRLGSVNSYGEQKGVDALIAHDLSELARNRAIDAAFLVSGDEDILVGVQTAQTFGVRVHLLGIDPAHSQAQRLRYEADVCHEWPDGLVAPWVSLRGDARGGGPALDMEPVLDAMQPTIAGRERAIVDAWDRGNRIAREVDSPLMRVLVQRLGRQLTPGEKPPLRQAFVERLRERVQSASENDDTVAGADAGEDELRDAFEPEVSDDQVAAIAAELVPTIAARLPRILQNWDDNGRLPVDVNVQLLRRASAITGHEIANRAALRDAFVSALRAAAAEPAGGELNGEIDGDVDGELNGEVERDLAPDQALSEPSPSLPAAETPGAAPA